MKAKGTSLLAITALTLALFAASTAPTRAASHTFILYQGTTCLSSGHSFCFGDGKTIDPTLTVNQGDFVNVTVLNNDTITHTFTIVTAPYTSINIVNNAGERHSQTFTANTAGSFTYECTQDSHASLGMMGTFKVNAVTQAPLAPVALLTALLLASTAVYVSRRRL